MLQFVTTKIQYLQSSESDYLRWNISDTVGSKIQTPQRRYLQHRGRNHLQLIARQVESAEMMHRGHGLGKIIFSEEVVGEDEVSQVRKLTHSVWDGGQSETWFNIFISDFTFTCY